MGGWELGDGGGCDMEALMLLNFSSCEPWSEETRFGVGIRGGSRLSPRGGTVTVNLERLAIEQSVEVHEFQKKRREARVTWSDYPRSPLVVRRSFWALPSSLSDYREKSDLTRGLSERRREKNPC